MWYQFSVYTDEENKSFPKKPFNFLRPFYYELKDEMGRWYFLFEPNILVRFEAYDLRQANKVYDKGWDIGLKTGFSVVKGDIAKSSPSGMNGFYHFGEQEFYKSGELWECNADFMWASSRAALLIDTHEDPWEMSRKFAHLFANTLGMNYKQEAEFFTKNAKRARELYKKYGEQ